MWVLIIFLITIVHLVCILRQSNEKTICWWFSWYILSFLYIFIVSSPHSTVTSVYFNIFSLVSYVAVVYAHYIVHDAYEMELIALPVYCMSSYWELFFELNLWGSWTFTMFPIELNNNNVWKWNRLLILIVCLSWMSIYEQHMCLSWFCQAGFF